MITPTVSVTFRIPPELKERLERAAEERGIPQNTIIVQMLERELADAS